MKRDKSKDKKHCIPGSNTEHIEAGLRVFGAPSEHPDLVFRVIFGENIQVHSMIDSRLTPKMLELTAEAFKDACTEYLTDVKQ